MFSAPVLRACSPRLFSAPVLRACSPRLFSAPGLADAGPAEYRHVTHTGMQSFAVLNVAIAAQLRSGTPKPVSGPVNSEAGRNRPVRQGRNRTGAAAQVAACARRSEGAGGGGGAAETLPGNSQAETANRGGTRALVSAAVQVSRKGAAAGPRPVAGPVVGAGVSGQRRPGRARSMQVRIVNRPRVIWPAPPQFGWWQLPAGGRARSVFDSPFSHGKSARASVQRPSCAIA